MNTTSASLLIRLKSASDHQAWSRFIDLYTPLLFYWARKTGLQSEDAADLVQEVLTIVHQHMPDFVYQPDKSFRGWLRTVTLNKYREWLRKKPSGVVHATPQEFANVPQANLAESVWDVSYQQSLVSSAMQLLSKEFSPRTWQALRLYVISDQPAAEVAGETGVSIWTIYAAKSRLMSRLREELAGMLE